MTKDTDEQLDEREAESQVWEKARSFHVLSQVLHPPGTSLDPAIWKTAELHPFGFLGKLHHLGVID